MNQLITLALKLAAITVIAFVFATMFVDGLLNELELREEHARIHWKSR